MHTTSGRIGRRISSGLAVMIAVACAGFPQACRADDMKAVQMDLRMAEPFVATNPVVLVTWRNVSEEVVTWQGAVTNASVTSFLHFFDLFADEEVCVLRSNRYSRADFASTNDVRLAGGTSVTMPLIVCKRWLVPQSWQRLAFELDSSNTDLRLMTSRGYSEVVNQDEVFIFDRNGNRVQETDTEP